MNADVLADAAASSSGVEQFFYLEHGGSRFLRNVSRPSYLPDYTELHLEDNSLTVTAMRKSDMTYI
jgi:hypothetical protein